MTQFQPPPSEDQKASESAAKSASFLHYAGLCWACKHRYGYVDDIYGTVCDAYPTGIPLRILAGLDDHRQPQPGDHGILYEAGPKNTTDGPIRYFWLSTPGHTEGALWISPSGDAIGWFPTPGHGGDEAAGKWGAIQESIRQGFEPAAIFRNLHDEDHGYQVLTSAIATAPSLTALAQIEPPYPG